MSNVLEFYLKMKDMMSSGLAKVAVTAKDTFKKMQGYIDDTIKHNNKLADSFDNVNKKASSSGGGLSKFFDVLKGGIVAGGIGALLSVGAVAGMVKDSVAKYAQFEATNKSFEVLTGSKVKGQGLANDLNKLQRDTILGPEVFKNAQVLLGFGVETEKILPTLKMLGDVSMGDAEKLKSLTLAFAQTTSAGKLTGQDLLQYVNAGFNPLNEIAKMTGKSVGDLRKEMEKGAISSDMVVKAFEAATGKGGKFNDMMNQMATTTQGQLAQMDGQIESSMIAIGEKYKWTATVMTGLKAYFIDLIAPHKRLQDSIINEKTEINTLVGAITNLNTNNQVRLSLLSQLKNTYPEIFGAIDTETVKNGQLLEMLNNVNAAYEKRIALAVNQQTANDTKEMVDTYFNSLVQDTKFAQEQGSGKKWYWDERLAGDKKRYEDALNAYNRANSVNQAGQSMQRIQDIMAFTGDPAKMAGFKGRPKDEAEFLKLVNTWRGQGFASGFGMNELTRAEALMKGPSSIKAASATASGEGKGSGSVAGNITGGGPRVINIHGVKFMDKLELHTATFNEGADEIEKRFHDMFMRLLNSGASVQS